jgi:rhodanese-related sulfurtransferase
MMVGVSSVLAQGGTNSPAAASPPGRRVAVGEFAGLAASTNVVILDVRTAEEFKAGHIKGAVNMDFLESHFAENVGKLDRHGAYLVYCAGGGRSAQACRKMSAMGFTNMVDLAPGFSGWKREGQPVEK